MRSSDIQAIAKLYVECVSDMPGAVMVQMDVPGAQVSTDENPTAVIQEIITKLQGLLQTNTDAPQLAEIKRLVDMIGTEQPQCPCQNEENV